MSEWVGIVSLALAVLLSLSAFGGGKVNPVWLTLLLLVLVCACVYLGIHLLLPIALEQKPGKVGVPPTTVGGRVCADATLAAAVHVRSGKHHVFRLRTGRIFVMSKSPSDYRAERNILASLRRALR